MKRRILRAVESVALVVAMMSPLGVIAAPATPKPQPKAPAAAPVPEPHPEIRDAIAALRAAREHLNQAAHDFGGHRADAIRSIDESLKQLQICLKYDR
jgi:hypothetical protein